MVDTYRAIIETCLLLCQLQEVALAQKVLYSCIFIQNNPLKSDSDSGQALYDLGIEFYLFLLNGDMRQQGRDTGFSTVSEISSVYTEIVSKEHGMH
jgi:hypothetical protein